MEDNSVNLMDYIDIKNSKCFSSFSASLKYDFQFLNIQLCQIDVLTFSW